MNIIPPDKFADAAVLLENLTKRYGRHAAVQDVSLSVPAGTVYGFLGPNGAGKTTTIRILLGFMRASAGDARALGLDCWDEGARLRDEVGYISGDVRLYPWLTLRRALGLFSRMRGRDITAYGSELGKQLELPQDVRVRAMSRGMRQKLGLIIALAHKPRLLVLDEPTAALDPIMQQTLYTHLRERAADGTTVFFSSHTLSEVEGLCDRVAILRAGKLVEDEQLAVLRSRARRRVMVRWSGRAADPPPGLLEVEEKGNGVLRGWLTGEVPAFLAWAAAQPVADMTLSAPDLDHLFHQYYRDAGR